MQRRDEAAEDRERAPAVSPARSYLLRLFSQGNAQGPEARLELSNIDPPIFVQVQLLEEISVARVAVLAPVAGSRRQNEAFQELEHGGAVRDRRRDARPSAPAAWVRTADTACAAANAQSGPGRGPSGEGQDGARGPPRGGARPEALLLFAVRAEARTAAAGFSPLGRCSGVAAD